MKLEVRGHAIDLDRLYEAMWEEADVRRADGTRVYRGNAKTTRSIKRLLHDLFAVPVKDTIEPTNAEARRAVTLELARLGWATKVTADDEPALEGTASRSSRYLLHRILAG